VTREKGTKTASSRSEKGRNEPSQPDAIPEQKGDEVRYASVAYMQWVEEKDVPETVTPAVGGFALGTHVLGVPEETGKRKQPSAASKGH